MTELLARSFISHFSNAFLDALEKVRTPHLLRVVQNLRDFAKRVPPKYRVSIEKALKTDGFLSFLLARASLGLLCAKATMRRPPGKSIPALSKEHEDLATVVEELYIAAMLHAEEQWDQELKADGKTFMAVASTFATLLADPSLATRANVQSALFGFDAKPYIWTKYGLDMLGISWDLSMESMMATPRSPSGYASGYDIEAVHSEQARRERDFRKVSLLGGDSLYATAQWAMANLDSRPCRKLIAKTIAMYSDGQLRKREVKGDLDLTIRQVLDIEKTAGVAAFFSASAACAALVNGVDDDIAKQVAEFGADIGLIVGLLRDTRNTGIRSALTSGRITAPIISAMEQDPELREMLSQELSTPSEIEEVARRVKEHGVVQTLRLVNRLGYRAVARLQCMEDTIEKEALMTLTRGIGLLPSQDEVDSSCWKHPEVLPRIGELEDGEGAHHFSKRFDLKVDNLRLTAELQRMRSSAREATERLDSIRGLASGAVASPLPRSPMVGLGLALDPQELDWLLLRGLERRAPIPDRLDLSTLLSCIADDQAEVHSRLNLLSEAANSQVLKRVVREVFNAGGKRLRPALCLLVHQMLRQEAPGQAQNKQGHVAAIDPVLVLATAIEIIHTASLMHDDILDDADFRRHEMTMHKLFGSDVAVLSGDFLFAHASGMIESLENDEVTRIVSLVIEEFGYGELAQSAKAFDTNLALFDYLRKSYYKTASLLAAACRASVVLSGCPGEICDVTYSYGFYLGIAFQIADDVLDFSPDGAAELGKPAFQDLAEGTLTAPVLLCLQGSEDLGLDPAPGAEELGRLIRGRFAGEGDFDRALELIKEGRGLENAYRLAEKMADKALENLMLVAPHDSDARRALAGLTRWAIRRRS